MIVFQAPDFGSGGFVAGLGAGIGLAAAGVAFLVKNMRAGGGSGTNGVGAKIDLMRQEVVAKLDQMRQEFTGAVKEHHEETRKAVDNSVTRALLQRDLDQLRSAKARRDTTRG